MLVRRGCAPGSAGFPVNARRPGSTPACRRCPHARDGHKPYIPGAGKPGFCGSCGCWQFQPERLWTQLLAWFRRQPAPVVADVLRQHPVPYPVAARGDDGWDENRTQLNIPIARPYAGGDAS